MQQPPAAISEVGIQLTLHTSHASTLLTPAMKLTFALALPLISLAMAASAAQPTELTSPQRLAVGPGPEDVCAAVWRGQPVAIVSCAERRKAKGHGDPTNCGFCFIGLGKQGPTIIGRQSFGEAGSELPWSGLYWQAKGIPGFRHGVVAAVRTGCYVHGEFKDLQERRIDLFEWDETSKEPRLKLLPESFQPKTLAAEKKGSFNAVALTSSGDIFATTFGLFGTWGLSPVIDGSYASKAQNNALYRWSHELGKWILEVRRVSGANGLALSADERLLAVAAYHAKKIRWYNLSKDGGIQSPEKATSSIKGWCPDNMKQLADGSIAAVGSGKITTGINLIFSNKFGCGQPFKTSGVVLVMPGDASVTTLTPKFKLPRGYTCPSGVTQLGGWWLASQILDEELLFWPVAH